MKRFKTASQPDGHSDKEYYDLLGDAIYDHVQQQIELSVDKALDVLEAKFQTLKDKSENLKDMLYLDGVMAVISTSKDEILNEIKDR